MFIEKLGCLLTCIFLGAVFALGIFVASVYNEYNNLTKQALEQNVTTKQFHIYNITETDDESKYLDTTEGIRFIVKKDDDLFWTYKSGDEISVTYGRADKYDKSIYNYKITSLLSSGNEYKPVEQKKTLKWKYLQEKIED